jgi:hypothetical protein
VQHEIHARQKRHVLKRIGGLVGGLRIGQFRAAERPARPVGQVQAPRQLARAVGDLLASGVPKVGAPEFMSIEVTKAPKITGAPGGRAG